MKWLTLSALILLILGIPVSAGAAEIRSNNNVEIGSEETISGNLYIAGGRSVVDGSVEGDLSVAAGDVYVTGTISDDVNIVGGDSAFSGSVLGDLRIIGGNIKVSGQIGGDLVLVGGEVSISPETSVGGDIILVGGRISLDGTGLATTSLWAVGGNVKLKGELGGNNTITTQQLDLEDNTKILGALNYFSPGELSKGSNVDVVGPVNFNRVSSIKDNGVIKQAVISFLNFWILLRFITTLLLTFLIVYIFKSFAQKTAEYTLDSFFPSFLIGLLISILMPVIILILFMSLILIPISILLTLSYFFIFIVSTAVSGIAVGALIKKAFSKEGLIEVTFNTAALGVVIITLLQFVPFVGEITRTLFFLAAFGAVWRHIYTQIRWGDIVLPGIKK